MHVMIATDGSLDPVNAATAAARLAGDNGQVTVYAVVEIPRGMLDEMRKVVVESQDEAVQQAGAEFRKSQAADPPPTKWVGDQLVVDRYVAKKVEDRTARLVTELANLGANYEVVGEEGENPAKSVLDAAASRGVDVICIGTHGMGRFEGLLGSLSTKVARHAPCSVLLVR